MKTTTKANITKAEKLKNVRTKVGNLIDIDLNLKHSKIKRPIQDISVNIWKDRVPENKSILLPLPEKEKDNSLSLFCMINLLKCIVNEQS